MGDCRVHDGKSFVARLLFTLFFSHFSNGFLKPGTKDCVPCVTSEMNSMISTAIRASLPLLVLAVTSVAVMIGIAIKRSHRAAAAISFVGLTVSFILLWPASSATPVQITSLLVIDRYALVYMGLVLAASAAVVLLSFGY